MQKLKPIQLRGNIEKQNFFEGWFHKIYSPKHQTSFIIIYGYTTGNSDDKFGFIQILIPHKSIEIFYFPKNEISFNPKQHIIQMGSNILSTKQIKINYKDININLNLLDNQPIYSYKNSMGYSYFIPTLPCYHSVLNKSHYVSGEVNFHNQHYLMDSALGYMEKNWGTSFPENYFWMHAIDPSNPEISILFSQAEIKWLGKSFIKHLGHFRFNGEEINLKKLAKFEINYSFFNKDYTSVVIKSSQIKLEINFGKSTVFQFKGPVKGKLQRDIIHNSDTLIDLKIYRNNEIKELKLIGNFEKIGDI